MFQPIQVSLVLAATSGYEAPMDGSLAELPKFGTSLVQVEKIIDQNTNEIDASVKVVPADETPTKKKLDEKSKEQTEKEKDLEKNVGKLGFTMEQWDNLNAKCNGIDKWQDLQKAMKLVITSRKKNVPGVEEFVTEKIKQLDVSSIDKLSFPQCADLYHQVEKEANERLEEIKQIMEIFKLTPEEFDEANHDARKRSSDFLQEIHREMERAINFCRNDVLGVEEIVKLKKKTLNKNTIDFSGSERATLYQEIKTYMCKKIQHLEETYVEKDKTLNEMILHYHQLVQDEIKDPKAMTAYKKELKKGEKRHLVRFECRWIQNEVNNMYEALVNKYHFGKLEQDKIETQLNLTQRNTRFSSVKQYKDFFDDKECNIMTQAITSFRRGVLGVDEIVESKKNALDKSDITQFSYSECADLYQEIQKYMCNKIQHLEESYVEKDKTLNEMILDYHQLVEKKIDEQPKAMEEYNKKAKAAKAAKVELTLPDLEKILIQIEFDIMAAKLVDTANLGKEKQKNLKKEVNKMRELNFTSATQVKDHFAKQKDQILQDIIPKRNKKKN